MFNNKLVECLKYITVTYGRFWLKKKKKNLTVCNTAVPPKGVGRQILKATGTTLVHILPLLCIYFPDEKVLTVVPDHSA